MDTWNCTDIMANTDTEITWPPAYTLRHSARAKRVILQISPKQGLVVVVPIHRRHPKIEEVLREKQHWIQKNLSHLHAQQKLSTTPQIFSPPTLLELHAINVIVQFEYQKTSHKYLKIIPYHNDNPLPANMLNEGNNLERINTPFSDSNGQQLSESNKKNTLHYLIVGPIENHSLLIKALKRFLKQIAQQFLIPWLQELSAAIGLPFQTASIRSQSTLWGSCTAAKKISLNLKLLFLPQELTRYVLLHELCHTQHLNHSKRYWNLLKRFDNHCLVHRRMLRSAGQYVPTWIEDTIEDSLL